MSTTRRQTGLTQAFPRHVDSASDLVEQEPLTARLDRRRAWVDARVLRLGGRHLQVEAIVFKPVVICLYRLGARAQTFRSSQSQSPLLIKLVATARMGSSARLDQVKPFAAATSSSSEGNTSNAAPASGV